MAIQNTVNEQMPKEPTPKDELLTKEDLELKKLALEIKDLERPFWKRPSYVLAALPTLLAIVALIVGSINGFFSAQLTKLENQKHDLEAQIKEFESTKNSLISQNDQLRQELTTKQERLRHIKEILTKVQDTAKMMENIVEKGRTQDNGGIDFSRLKEADPFKIFLIKTLQPNLHKLLDEMAAATEDKNKQD